MAIVALQVQAENTHKKAPVRVDLDTSTGIPQDEQQPPHGVVRWRLLTPENEGVAAYRPKCSGSTR